MVSDGSPILPFSSGAVLGSRLIRVPASLPEPDGDITAPFGSEPYRFKRARISNTGVSGIGNVLPTYLHAVDWRYGAWLSEKDA